MYLTRCVCFKLISCHLSFLTRIITICSVIWILDIGQIYKLSNNHWHPNSQTKGQRDTTVLFFNSISPVIIWSIKLNIYMLLTVFVCKIYMKKSLSWTPAESQVIKPFPMHSDLPWYFALHVLTLQYFYILRLFSKILYSENSVIETFHSVQTMQASSYNQTIRHSSTLSSMKYSLGIVRVIQQQYLIVLHCYWKCHMNTVPQGLYEARSF